MRVLMIADLSEPSSRALAAARGLVARGHDIRVLTPDRGVDHGPLVTPVPDHPPVISTWDQVAGSLQRDLALLERGLRLAQDQAVDVVDARGWRVAHAASGLRDAFALPLVASFDAVRRIERRGRRWTRGDELVEQTGSWLASVASAVVVRSRRASEILTGAVTDPAAVVVIAGDGTGDRHAARLEHVYAAARTRAKHPVRALARA